MLSDLDPNTRNPSVKLVANCESLLFQRPDDAIHRGFDKQAEADIASPGTFLSNFEPLTREQAQAIVDHVVEFDEYTEPMKRLLAGLRRRTASPGYVVSSAHPRLVDGKPSKNPRYLQKRPDLCHRARHLRWPRSPRGSTAEFPPTTRLHFPVNAVLAGPPQQSARPQTRHRRRWPSTTRFTIRNCPSCSWSSSAASPANRPPPPASAAKARSPRDRSTRCCPIVDLNNALVSVILTGYAGFTTSAGYVGPHYRVDHDISMLVPEIWCRMRVAERDPRFLIDNGYLERVEDFELRRPHRARQPPRLSHHRALCGVASSGASSKRPTPCSPKSCCGPSSRIPRMFAAGVDAIVEASGASPSTYFEDGSVEAACPPLKALLHIMAQGSYEGMTLSDPRLRALFTRGAVLASDWYTERLRAKQRQDMRPLAPPHRCARSLPRLGNGSSRQISISTSVWPRPAPNASASVPPPTSPNWSEPSAPTRRSTRFRSEFRLGFALQACTVEQCNLAPGGAQ